MFKEFTFLCLFLYLFGQLSEAYLQVKGKELLFKGEKIYLSGANIAWNELGSDWGNGKYWGHRTKMNEWLAGISAHGGNVARVWVHFWGSTSPQFDSKGFTVGTDKQNDLVKELQALMEDAEKHNVFIILCLFHALVFKTNNGFIHEDSKVQSYIDKALKPMVIGLKGRKALAAWEVMNEPEGDMDINYKDTDTNACFDTKRWHISNTRMGNKVKCPMKRVLRFVNWITAAIHAFDSSALVTVGALNPTTNTNKCSNCYNIYSNDCLLRAGGKAKGKLDFYQIHTYECSAESPIKRTAEQYGLDRPLIIGEFSAKKSCVNDSSEAYKHYYNSGYNGCLAWQYNDHHDRAMDSRDVINHGMESIRNDTKNGVIGVHISA